MKSTALVAVLLVLVMTACSQKAAEAPAAPAPVVEAQAPAPVVDVVSAPAVAPVNTAAPTASLAAGIQVELKADSGKYLARCNNCMPRGAYPDSAFVHVIEAQLANAPWAHWDLIIVP